jgi:hypothetical protein
VVSDDWVINELGSIFEDMAVDYCRYYPGICLERPRGGTKDISQYSRPPGRDFNPGPPEFKTRVLTTAVGA